MHVVMCVRKKKRARKQADNRKLDKKVCREADVCVCVYVCVSMLYMGIYSESLLGGNPDVRTRLLLDELLHLRIHFL